MLDDELLEYFDEDGQLSEDDLENELLDTELAKQFNRYLGDLR